MFIFMLLRGNLRGKKRLHSMLWGFSKHTCASLCRLLNMSWCRGPTQDPCVSFCYISPKNTLCMSLMYFCGCERWRGRENSQWRKFELFVLYLSFSRTVPTPQPHTLVICLPLCPQHLLLRNTMRRRCHWALEQCQNTSSPEVSSFLCW